MGTHKRQYTKDKLQNISPEIFSFSEEFLKCQQERHPTLIRDFDGRVKAGAIAVNDLIRIDKMKLEDIKSVVRWAAGDQFWSTNLLSLASLRNRGKNGEMKITNIMASMRRSKGINSDTDWLTELEMQEGAHE